jgi:serine/threonine protein kinase
MELALTSVLRGDNVMSMLSTSVLRGVDEIGPYQILEDLGPVPFGMAYLALDSRTDQRALLKVIPPSRPGLQQEETPWDVLVKETRALLRISHRGIPPLFEISEQEGMLLVAFGAVAGSTLHDLMVQGKRPNRGLLVDWGCQLLDILAEAHAAGIVHRHVTEEQVLVTPDGRMVLMGFGLTQIHFDPLAAFPPERSSGEPLTPQSDLHAVGLLLRRLAFASGLRGERGLGTPRRDPLLKVLARASFPNPAARFRDAREMADALRQAGRAGAPARESRPSRSGTRSDPQPILARLPARPESPRMVREEGKEDRKLALLLLTTAVLLLLMLIAAGWFLIGHNGPPPPDLPGGTATSTALRAPA